MNEKDQALEFRQYLLGFGFDEITLPQKTREVFGITMDSIEFLLRFKEGLTSDEISVNLCGRRVNPVIVQKQLDRLITAGKIRKDGDWYYHNRDMYCLKCETTRDKCTCDDDPTPPTHSETEPSPIVPADGVHPTMAIIPVPRIEHKKREHLATWIIESEGIVYLPDTFALSSAEKAALWLVAEHRDPQMSQREYPAKAVECMPRLVMLKLISSHSHLPANHPSRYLTKGAGERLMKTWSAVTEHNARSTAEYWLAGMPKVTDEMVGEARRDNAAGTAWLKNQREMEDRNYLYEQSKKGRFRVQTNLGADENRRLGGVA